MCITQSQMADATTLFFVSLSRQLTDTHIMNGNRITELKEKIAQLELLCQAPCKDRAEIQETTGRGVQNAFCVVEGYFSYKCCHLASQ